MRTKLTKGPWRTMADVKRANRAAGRFWFSKATLAYFNSRVGSKIFAGRLFISSESHRPTAPRLYAINVINDDATIETDQSKRYPTYAAARAAAEGLAKTMKGD